MTKNDHLKIIHVCQYYNEGYGYQENLLPRYQAKLGHKVMVITSDRMSYFSGGKDPKIVGSGEFEDNGIRILRLPIKTELKGRFVVFNNLYDILKREKPDYIFHHGLISPSIKTVCKYKKKNPSTFLVADNHADLDNSARNPLWRLSYYRIYSTFRLKKCINYIDLVFGVTPARCYFAENELGIPHDLIRLLPVGADEFTVKEHLEKKDFLDNNYNNINNKLKVVTGGKWSEGKGLKELISAVQDLNVELQIFGKLDDSYTKNIIEQAPNNVTFLGWQDRIGTLRLLASADVAVWPKLHTTLVEDAIATKTPLILRYQGNTSHHIRENGVYLFTGTSIEIRQILDILSNSENLINKMKENSKKQLDLLSYKRIAKESIEYYYDKSAKTTHEVFMNDPLCNPSNRDFHKLS
ncbi:glycosyltransferase [Petrotoga halophila]|uniref:Glycosyltransferase subfamily 4-like N-terminal domain-containing protein n=1 Tax=Petrotoga halophila DSM 16923 TaxID=1122953 RepID=A0A2S5EGY0_9BACT|nr:glycosyltransferase [Petrotoga halophila]POZ92401.1 hypothetical protein AA81_07510 [Petrotoga halophila DSM 16923]